MGGWGGGGGDRVELFVGEEEWRVVLELVGFQHRIHRDDLPHGFAS